MRLSPDKTGINQLEALMSNTLDLFKAVTHHLRRLWLDVLPSRCLPVPVTLFTMLNGDLFIDTFSDVNLVLETLHAGVC